MVYEQAPTSGFQFFIKKLKTNVFECVSRVLAVGYTTFFLLSIKRGIQHLEIVIQHSHLNPLIWRQI